jgi:hypothetical protein
MTRFFNASWQPRRLLAISDINGDRAEELVVLGEHASGRIATQIKTARGGFGLRTDDYFGPSWRFRDVVDLGDANGRGYDELAVLAQRRNGQHAVIVRNAGTGRELADIRFDGGDWSASRLGSIADANDSGARELTIVAQRNDGRINVLVKDALDGTNVGRQRFLGGAWSPQSLVVLPQVGRRGAIGLGLVATRGSDGRIRMEAKEAVTGRDVAAVWIR